MPFSIHKLHVRPCTHLAEVGILATMLFLALAMPARGTVIHHEHFSFSDSFPDVICGVSVRHDVEVSGVGHVRVGKHGLTTAFFGMENYSGTGTLTNEANGNFVTVEHNGLLHDTKATLVSGTVFRFETIESGQPIRIRDMTGRVVARDRGVIRDTYLFDTLGDDTPGGLYLEQLRVRVSGPHSMLVGDFDEAAFCAVVRPLLLS
jgi:hypothetical protein